MLFTEFEQNEENKQMSARWIASLQKWDVLKLLPQASEQEQKKH